MPQLSISDRSIASIGAILCGLIVFIPELRAAETNVVEAPGHALVSGSGLERLPSADLLRVALGMLDERESALRNCRFKLVETATNIDKSSGAERLMFQNQYEFRRTEGCAWLRAVTHSIDEPGAISSISTVNWDGQIARGIGDPKYQHSDHPFARVDPKESRFFTSVHFFEILGFRIDTTPVPLPVAAWLRDQINRGKPVEAKIEDYNGARTIHIVVATPVSSITRELWLDASKEFMIVRVNSALRHPGGRGVTSTQWVTESRAIQGHWIPLHTVRVGDTLHNKEKTRTEYEVDGEFQVGTVTPDDVAIGFPPGAKVTDSVHNVAYTVLANGKFELKDLADLGAMNHRAAPEKRIVDRIDGSTATSYRVTALASNVVPISHKWSTGRRVSVFLSASALIVSLLVFWSHRRRRRGSTSLPR
jgi:hypothetical protein